MSDFDLVTLKHEGTTICDTCHRMVGERHAPWCAYVHRGDEVVTRTYQLPRLCAERQAQAKPGQVWCVHNMGASGICRCARKLSGA